MAFDLKNHSKKLVGNNDERAVSPVIGVILMVAITVILAAVIAAFVLDMGDLDESAPNAQYEWEHDTDSSPSVISVSHVSGDDISSDNVKVSVTGSSISDVNVDAPSDLSAGSEWTITEEGDGGDIELGTGDSLGDVEKVTVTWESDGTSSILTDYEP